MTENPSSSLSSFVQKFSSQQNTRDEYSVISSPVPRKDRDDQRLLLACAESLRSSYAAQRTEGIPSHFHRDIVDDTSDGIRNALLEDPACHRSHYISGLGIYEHY